MIAKTLPGLEPVLEQELIALGAQNVQIGRRMVSYEGDQAMLYKSNLHLRTALKILKPIYEFDAEDIDILYATLLRYDWGQWLEADSTFAVEAVVYSSTFTHSRYCIYRTKDAIVDFFTKGDASAKRPVVKLSNPQYIFHLHISEQHVTLCLDSSGESLHKRGYRLEQSQAPLNEVLAAGILLKAGWEGQCDLMDPFCGSGTFLIEAALIATGTPPGIYRDNYSFERWSDFDADLFDELYNDESGAREFSHRIYGSDLSPQAVSMARRNVQRAGMGRYIDLEVRDFADQKLPTTTNATDDMEQTDEQTQTPACIVVMNPPYGARLNDYDLEHLYRMIGSTLKYQFTNAQAWVIAHDAEHFHSIGLKHDYREKLFNGSLECELRGYTLFAGKQKEYKEQLAEEGEEAMRAGRPDRKGGARPERRRPQRGERTYGRPDRDRQRPDRERPDRERRPFDREHSRPERGDRDHKPFDRDRKPFDRDRKPFDRDRKPFDRDHKPFDRDRKSFDKGRRDRFEEEQPRRRDIQTFGSDESFAKKGED